MKGQSKFHNVVLTNCIHYLIYLISLGTFVLTTVFIALRFVLNVTRESYLNERLMATGKLGTNN